MPAEGDRNPLRRFRGRLPSPVTVWATGQERSRRGLTVSSILIADGEPGRVLGLIDPESDFWDAEPANFTVNILGPGNDTMADAFAGIGPAPGGPFTLGDWGDSPWGPVLADSPGWLGVRLESFEPRDVGWALLVEGTIENVQNNEGSGVAHIRGRYRDLHDR